MSRYQPVPTEDEATSLQFTDLPQEIVESILSYLHPGQILRYASVSPAFAEAARSEYLWREVCIREKLWPPVTDEDNDDDNASSSSSSSSSGGTAATNQPAAARSGLLGKLWSSLPGGGSSSGEPPPVQVPLVHEPESGFRQYMMDKVSDYRAFRRNYALKLSQHRKSYLIRAVPSVAAFFGYLVLTISLWGVISCDSDSSCSFHSIAVSLSLLFGFICSIFRFVFSAQSLAPKLLLSLLLILPLVSIWSFFLLLFLHRWHLLDWSYTAVFLPLWIPLAVLCVFSIFVIIHNGCYGQNKQDTVIVNFVFSLPPLVLWLSIALRYYLPDPEDHSMFLVFLPVRVAEVFSILALIRLYFVLPPPKTDLIGFIILVVITLLPFTILSVLFTLIEDYGSAISPFWCYFPLQLYITIGFVVTAVLLLRRCRRLLFLYKKFIPKLDDYPAIFHKMFDE